MTDARAAVEELRSDIERAGYHPQLVTDGVWAMLGDEPVLDHLVHHEATFDHELRRHLTVLVLTPTRLIFGHTDEHTPHEGHEGHEGHEAHVHATSTTAATTSTEVVALRHVRSVVLTRVVDDATRYQQESAVDEIVLTVGWGAINRVELEPASCDDPQCEADHGFSGTLTADDFVLRVSRAAEGVDLVGRAQRFAASLSAATARVA